jgi:hypothetical protein
MMQQILRCKTAYLLSPRQALNPPPHGQLGMLQAEFPITVALAPRQCTN